jgi:hypothetical protein
MIDSDQCPDSNRHPLTSLSQITVWFKDILKSASFPNSQIYGRFIGWGICQWLRFEKVRNYHRFENWMRILEFEKGQRYSGIDVCVVEIRPVSEGWTSIWGTDFCVVEIRHVSEGWTSIWDTDVCVGEIRHVSEGWTSIWGTDVCVVEIRHVSEGWTSIWGIDVCVVETDMYLRVGRRSEIQMSV